MVVAAASPLDARPQRLAGDATWAPRRQLSLEQARKRSQQLSGLRLLFVSLAAASFSSVFVFMVVHAAIGGFSDQGEVAANAPQQMLNPRFAGRNEAGETFEVTAVTAIRQSEDPNLVDLDRPVYRTRDGRTVQATRGLYNQTTGAVQLTGDVVFADPKGYRFESTGAKVEGESGRIVGERAIRGAGPLGTIRADSYEVARDGSRLSFRGRVKGVIKEGRGGQS
jgi:lipopolysaccharide export system protein LptC